MKVSATCYSHSTQIRACLLVNGTPTWTMSDSLLKSEICGWPMCFPWSMNIIEQLSVVMSAMLLCDSQWGLASLESFVKKSSMLKINCHLQMLVDCFQFSFTAPFISKCPGTCDKWSSQKVPRLYRHIETCRDKSVSILLYHFARCFTSLDHCICLHQFATRGNDSIFPRCKSSCILGGGSV